jgi:tRNA G10  N-methylase Trm11
MELFCLLSSLLLIACPFLIPYSLFPIPYWLLAIGYWLLAKMYLYLTAYTDIEKELARAECQSLCGVTSDDKGLAISEKCIDVFRAAYVKTGAQILISALNKEELFDKLVQLNLESDRFRVSVKKFVKSDWGSHQIMTEVGARIGGKADLQNPKEVFLVVLARGRVFLSRVLSVSDKAWMVHIDKPYNTSSSLPSRIARAMVNLVAEPGQKLVDPCCGTGTIIIEAACAKMKPTGYDLNPKMVEGTLKNLEYFKLSAEVRLGDAKQISGDFEALATDLPYGINTKLDLIERHQILENFVNLSKRCAVVTANDIRQELEKCGYQLSVFASVPVSIAFSRYVHVFSTSSP